MVLQQTQNLNAIRTWLFANGNGEGLTTDTTARAAQITPGVYNETVLRRFDRVIATASECHAAWNCMLIISRVHTMRIISRVLITLPYRTGEPCGKGLSSG